MKKCFKCNEVKPLDDFYKHEKMADGHVNKCKECNKKDVRENRAKRIDYYRRYDAWRYQNDPRVKGRMDEYAKTERGKLLIYSAKAAWDDRNKQAKSCHGIVRYSVRTGKIKKPDNCSCCGEYTTSRLLHAHHHDYSLPLDITWLCVKCHSFLHNGDIFDS